MELHPKFIIEDGNLIIGKVEYNNIKCEHIVKTERQSAVFNGNISKKN
jgi:hypothetical protein